MKTNGYTKTQKIIPFRNSRIPVYPNAAANRVRLEKLLDYLLTAAMGAGFTTALLFLFTVL